MSKPVMCQNARCLMKISLIFKCYAKFQIKRHDRCEYLLSMWDIMTGRHGPFYASVMHPRLASSTIFTYLYNVPWLAFNGGATHALFRRASSSAETCSSIVFLIASTEIMSPSCTRAIGPPTWASGTTCPIQNPWDLQCKKIKSNSAVNFFRPEEREHTLRWSDHQSDTRRHDPNQHPWSN